MTGPTGIPPTIPANTPPDILLFRHAATDMRDGPRRYVGRTEVPLSPEGRAQAAAWRRRLAALDVVGAYASPLERARETARLMLGQGDSPDSADAPDTSGASATSGAAGSAAIPVTILDDLAEMDLGEWEGLVQMQVRETRPDAYARRGREPWTFRPPRANAVRMWQRAACGRWTPCGGTGPGRAHAQRREASPPGSYPPRAVVVGTGTAHSSWP